MRRYALLIALVLVACGGDDEPAAPASIPGTPWALVSGIDVPGWEQAAPSATFTGEHMGGNGGCNRYSAAYTLDGEKIRFGETTLTRMACGPPASAVETAFHAALKRVARWRLDEAELVLADDEGRELLRFGAASPIGRWEVTAFRQGDAVSSPIEGSKLTAVFEEGGKLTGSAGCNRYSSTFTLEPFTIRTPFATEMACGSPEGVMEQEQAYLKALPLAVDYTVEGSTLTLLTREGTIVATYARAS